MIINAAIQFADGSGEENTNNRYSIIDCTGLDMFENVKELYIYVAKAGKDYGIKNFNALYKLKNLRSIRIEGNTRTKQYDFGKFPQLKYIEMDSIKNADKIVFGGKSKVRNIYLRSISGKANLNLSKVKYLQKIDTISYNLRSIKFGSNKKLKKIEMSYYSGDSNKTIKRIDVSGVKNLEYLCLTKMKNLKTLKIGKLNQLEEIFVNSGKVKNVDISKCNMLRKVTLSHMGIKKLKVGEKQKIKYLDISGNKISNSKLKNRYVKDLDISYNPIKIDLKNFPKLTKVTISKKMKVLNKNKQKIEITQYTREGRLKK